MIVFWFWQKKLVRCVETVIWVYGGKNVKKNCWTIGFWSFLDFEKKNLGFCRKVFGRVAKNTMTCPVEHLQSKFSEWKSWKLEDFRKIFEVFGTRMEKLFQDWQNSNRCPREQFMKTFFPREKFALFFRFWANVYFQRNFLPELRNPQSMYPWKFLGKNNFWNIYNLSHFFRTLIQKTVSRKEIFFPGCHNCNSRVQRLFLRKSTIF